ncbi:hypothetical protein [Pseudomonas sp. MF6776]|uniref:hypothetical protein n=1 Tax=Pseudomonas sp. MF6776 TaxID=2797534 RepID=UPI00190BB523|nr:hypothetical protein [Pseudomonas sp. MF6776]MBK3468189.1 hypothetical protein [Pseudomonas sp. MF6776]
MSKRLATHADELPDTLEQGSGAQRRKHLIEIIVEHYLSGTRSKLKLKDVADRAGISRQALDRYYGDLKPYIAGERDVVDLVNGNERRSQVQTQAAINEVEAKFTEQIEQLKVKHEQELKQALDSHITSLMKGDIVLLESNKIRVSLERQTLHNADLLNQIHMLELKLALGADASSSIAKDTEAAKNNKVVFDLDIEALCYDYQRGKSFEAFEDQKNIELRKIRDKLSKYASTPNVRVILFADRYISRFKTFADQYVGLPKEVSLIIRLPLFSRSEIISFTKHIPASCKTSIHVPYFSGSESEKKLQRLGIYKQFPLPAEEIKGADNADQPSITWGFDEVSIFKVKPGSPPLTAR